MLCHAVQSNLAKQGTYSLCSRQEAVRGIFLQPLGTLWAQSVQVAYETIKTKCVRLHVTDMMKFRSWVCFDTWFLLMRYGVNSSSTVTGCNRSWLVEASRYPKLLPIKLFNWPVLSNLASKKVKKPILTKFLGKGVRFRAQIQQNWLKVFGQWYYLFMVLKVSYLYAKFLIETILTLAGLNWVLVLLTRTTARKGVTTQLTNITHEHSLSIIN